MFHGKFVLPFINDGHVRVSFQSWGGNRTRVTRTTRLSVREAQEDHEKVNNFNSNGPFKALLSWRNGPVLSLPAIPAVSSPASLASPPDNNPGHPSLNRIDSKLMIYF
jgi:hypothetical protein